MKVQHNVQLKDKTTFMVPAIAETYIELGSVEDVDGLISSNLLSKINISFLVEAVTYYLQRILRE